MCAELLCVAREAKRPVADQPGAEERRGLDVRVPLRDREAEARVGDRVLGVAAVEVVAGEARSVAEVLPAAQAVAALAARPAEPRDADAPAGRLVDADDLVAGHERQLRVGQLAVDDVQVGAADPAGADADEQLAGLGLRLGELGRLEPRALRSQDHRPHRAESRS